jgi:2-oxoglutarate/2-oxoacid ferredoxin oxidoreductase subunit beta
MTVTMVPVKKASFGTELLLSEDHPLCPGCGHPLAIRVILEVLQQLQLERRSVGIFGHGCSALMIGAIDVDMNLALHGRAPATATGVKRMHPNTVVFTMQGDGDMVSEGLAEVIHTAARGEKITCFLLNNGVFGDTGGHMTAASVIGQRTKTAIDGRDAEMHGHPLAIARIIAGIDGVSYVARASVHNAAGVTMAKRFVKRALEHQLQRRGFSLVEILTMCPTGWVKRANEGPDYMMETLGKQIELGEQKDTWKAD